MKNLVYLFILIVTSFQRVNFQNAEKFRNSVSLEVFQTFSLRHNADIRYCKDVIVAFPAGYEYLDCCGININYQFDKDEFYIQKQKILKKALYHYSDNDSCIILLPEFKSKHTPICSDHYIPIFDAYAGKAPLEKGFLPQRGLDYYIFEYKKGEFLKGEELKKMDEIDLFHDSTLNHGFSNGAIIDKNDFKIVYFIAIW